MANQSIELKVTIPEDYVLFKKEELNKLIEKADERVWISFYDLETITGLGRNKLDTILKRYRAELDISNGGPVKYPDGGRWSIEKDGMKKWLKDNHSRIWSDDLTSQL